MIHYGDITKISGFDVPITDVLVGGSPCQDLSVAGLRKGLSGERSGLFMDQIRITKEMREHDRICGRPVQLLRPRWFIWENVPGALSSCPKGGQKGADFKAVIEEVIGIVCEELPNISIPAKGWPKAGCFVGMGDDGVPFSVAYRIHDARWWGVPQRRRRISLVADLRGFGAPLVLFEPEYRGEAEDAESDQAVGDTGGCAGEVPALSEGMPGDNQQGEPEGQGAATGTAVGADVAGTLDGSYYKGCGERSGVEREVVVRGLDVYGQVPTGDCASTIRASRADNDHVPVACVEPMLLESNQNHATIQTNGISTALPAAMGEGGGYVPMVVHEND